MSSRRIAISVLLGITLGYGLLTVTNRRGEELKLPWVNDMSSNSEMAANHAFTNDLHPNTSPAVATFWPHNSSVVVLHDHVHPAEPNPEPVVAPTQPELAPPPPPPPTPATQAPDLPLPVPLPPVPAPKSKFAILMFVCNGARNGNICSLGHTHMEDKSVLNKKSWACRHGYDLIVEQNDCVPNDRPKVWGKLLGLKKHLRNYDWMLWTDLDTVLLDMSMTFEALIRVGEGKDLIVTNDWNGLNFGVFLIKNTPWAFDLIDAAWNFREALAHPFQEQYAVGTLINRPPHNQHSINVPLRTFNSYPSLTPGIEGCPSCIYQPGDFLIHFPGCHDQHGRSCEREFFTYFQEPRTETCNARHKLLDFRV